MKIDFKKPDTVFYFSFQCPYSYLSWELLKKKMANCNTRFKPIELSSNKALNSSFSFQEYWGENRWAKISSYAKELGISIKSPSILPDCSLSGSLVCEKNILLVEQIISAVFKAIFSDGSDVSKEKNLLKSLKANGLSDAMLKDLVYATNESDLTEEDQKKALIWENKKIRMLPTIEIGNDFHVGLLKENIYKKMLSHQLE